MPAEAPPKRGRRSRRLVAVALLAAMIVIISVPFVLVGCGDEDMAVSSTTTSSAPSPTSATSNRPAATSTTVKPSTTTTALPSVPGLPGDSPGAWVEMEPPALPGLPLSVSLSDEALLVLTGDSGSFKLVAHLFASGVTYEIPTGDADMWSIDVDGDTAVWWEGTFDDTTASYTDQRVYSYRLPDGPKTEIASGYRSGGYPQTAGPWLTWVESGPWSENPDEYWKMTIVGALLDEHGEPVDEPTVLVPSAIAFILGDSGWQYALSDRFLVWEQGAETDGLDIGSYVLDLGTLQIQHLGRQAWRPTLGGDIVVYSDEGLRWRDLSTGEGGLIDESGDFAAAAPTFAAYHRFEEEDEARYEIVARGYEGDYEQTLLTQADAPWLAAPISVAPTRVAFLAGGFLHVFQWEPR